MKYNLIASGSKGNSLLIKSKDDVLLFDCGISLKRLNEGLQVFNCSSDDIKDIFLTHTHEDHIKNVVKLNTDKIYVGAKKVKDKIINVDHILKEYQTITVNNLKVFTIPLSHDCSDSTFGYIIDNGITKIAYVTDTGFIPEKNFQYLKNLDYYIFESNHDPKMLYESKRPEHLKNRILSDKGHLSNSDSSYYLANLIGDKTKEIVFSHLSEECNTPELVLDTFKNVSLKILGYAPNVKLKVSTFYQMVIGGDDEY